MKRCHFHCSPYKKKGRGGGGGIQTSDRSERRELLLSFNIRLLCGSLCVCARVSERGVVEGVIRSTLKSISHHNYSELLITESLILHHLWVHGTRESSYTLSSQTNLAKPLFLHRRINFSLVDNETHFKRAQQTMRCHMPPPSCTTITLLTPPARGRQGGTFVPVVLMTEQMVRRVAFFFRPPLSVSDAFQSS